jgi:predicted Zn-dependent peptidase
MAMGAWVKVGTRHERGHEVGISHFLEHMLFKGTLHRSAAEIAQAIDTVGGEFNAFTTREYTCFHINLLKKDIDLAAQILCDVILDSQFDSEELERERKVILQEIAMIEDTPEELAYDLLFEKIYGKHGLGRPILGTPHRIKKISRGDLIRFFRKHYRPDELIITVCGDVLESALKQHLKPLLKKAWSGRLESSSKKHFVQAPKIRSGQWWAVRPTEQTHLVWAVPGLSLRHKDRFSLLLLNLYLGGNMSSLLFQEIREKNALAYTVYSSLYPYQDSGLMTIYAATAPTQVSQCLKLIESCVLKTTQELISDEMLSQLKTNLKSTLLLSSDSMENRMNHLGMDAVMDDPSSTYDEACDKIDQVTSKDLRRLARKLFVNQDRSILFLGKKPQRALKKKLKFVITE